MKINKDFMSKLDMQKVLALKDKNQDFQASNYNSH